MPPKTPLTLLAAPGNSEVDGEGEAVGVLIAVPLAPPGATNCAVVATAGMLMKPVPTKLTPEVNGTSVPIAEAPEKAGVGVVAGEGLSTSFSGLSTLVMSVLAQVSCISCHLRVDYVSYTVTQNDVGENDFGVVYVDSAVGANTQSNVISVDCRDSGVGDIASKHNGTSNSMVGEHIGECLDASICKSRGSPSKSLVVRDKDGKVRNGVDSLNQIGCCKSTDGGAHANLR